MCVFQHGQSRTDRQALFLKVSGGCQTASHSTGYSQARCSRALSLLELLDLSGHSFDFRCFMSVILHEMKLTDNRWWPVYKSGACPALLLLINTCSNLMHACGFYLSELYCFHPTKLMFF